MVCNWNKVNNDLSNAILESGRLDELLAELGCTKVKRERGQECFRATCPVHKGEHLNLAVRTNGTILPIYWKCHSVGCQNNHLLKPNLLSLVRGALFDFSDPASLYKARKFLEDFLCRDSDRPRIPRPNRNAQPQREVFTFSWPTIREGLQIPSPYFVERGFDPQVLEEFQIGDSEVFHRATIPIFDDSGLKCVGYVERSTFPQCDSCGNCHDHRCSCSLGELRWSFPRNFPRGDWLYNYAAVANSGSPFTLLVEGVPDVLRAVEVGVPALAGFGVNISATQTRKLAALGKHVVVAFDNDERGRTNAKLVVAALQREGINAVVQHPPVEFKDVGEMKAAEVANWIEEMMPSIPC